MWTRQEVEALKTYNGRPRVRVRLTRVNIDPDGRRSAPFLVDTTGQIVVDGNNPWIEVHYGRTTAERFSWGLVLDVLNDPHAAPIAIGGEFEMEV